MNHTPDVEIRNNGCGEGIHQEIKYIPQFISSMFYIYFLPARLCGKSHFKIVLYIETIDKQYIYCSLVNTI
jgi:hypothetical protein